MSLDITKYLHHFDGYEMTEEQKVDYLRSIERILQSFVDEAWGIEPSQIVLGTKRENGPAPRGLALNSDQSTTAPFNDAALSRG